MSESIMFGSLANKSPKQQMRSRIQRVGLYAAIADRITNHRQRKEKDSSKETHFSLGSIFAVGSYAVGVARSKLDSRHFTF